MTAVCQFARVENLIDFRSWCAGATESVAAFKDTKQIYSPENGGLWIKLGEMAAQRLSVAPYGQDKLEAAVEDLRELTQHEPHTVFQDGAEL